MHTNKKTKNMAQFEVTGITYCIGRDLPAEEAEAAAHEFIMSLPNGTTLTLQAEPSNVADPQAVAVYADYTRHVGYIKRAECPEVKALLDENGQCEAVKTGIKGRLTMVVEIPGAPEFIKVPPQGTQPRVLPENPLKDAIRMNFTESERALTVVAPRLADLKPTPENAARMLAMAECYLPLAALSICQEDSLWRNHIMNNLAEAAQMDIEPEMKEKLAALAEQLHDIEGEMTRSSDHPELELMNRQLDELGRLAEEKDGLLDRFERHVANSGSTVGKETCRLEQWFMAMPQMELQDYHDRRRLSRALLYRRVSREELYEVLAAIIVLEKYAHEQPASAEVEVVREYVMRLKGLLSAAWTESDYAQLWDDVLNLRQVKNALPEIGKQQNTTFNRQLVASILHVMKDRGVFAAKVTVTGMAITLEGDKNHPVRQEIGRTIEDRTLKSAIADLIASYSQQKS